MILPAEIIARLAPLVESKPLPKLARLSAARGLLFTIVPAPAGLKLIVGLEIVPGRMRRLAFIFSVAEVAMLESIGLVPPASI